MKRLLLFPILAFTPFAFGQTQLDNPGFEGAWEDVPGTGDEPIEWSSLKTADALGGAAPVVLGQSPDAHSGAYCVYLENIESFGIVANGLLTNGQVHADFDPENGYVFTNTSDDQWNQPFTDRPDSVVAWIKYNPIEGDKGKIEVLLHTGGGSGKLPETGATDHWVGKARYDIESASTEWTRVSAPFGYYSAINPAYVLVVITSGDSTIAIEGSEMWVDDIELIYNSPDASISTNETDFEIFSTNQSITVKSTSYEGARLSVYTMDGKAVYNAILTEAVSIHEINSSGVLLYRIEKDAYVSTGKIRLD